MGTFGVIGLAWRLDVFLKHRFGRLYNTVLGIGLVTGLSATIAGLTQAAKTKSIVELVGLVAFQSALLVNQLAQLHERREARRERRRARKTRRSETSPNAPSPGDGAG